jgi:VanZ family protein
MRTVLPFVVFAVFLGLWTWKLLEPNPVPEAVTAGWSLSRKFIAAKVLHVCGYGFLTLLAAWLPVRRPYFWVAVVGLMLHGCLTEYLQHALEVGRTGKVSDVLIDWLGVALAVAFLRVIRRPSSDSPSPPA